MSAESLSPGPAFAGMHSGPVEKQAARRAQRDLEEAARWKSEVKEALALPLLGKPHTLSEKFLGFFSRQHANPLIALWAWVEIADELETTLPAQGFFWMMPEICRTWGSNEWIYSR